MSKPHLEGKRTLSRLTAFSLRVLLPFSFVLIALAVQYVDSSFRVRLRNIAFDQLQNFSPLKYRDELPVRVIAIDDGSLEKLGQWPWPRTILAKMVDQLTAMGARVIALDMVLSEPDRTSPEQVAAFLPEQRALNEALKNLPSHDQALAKSFKRSQVAIGFPIEPVASSKYLPPSKAHFLSFGGDATDWLPNYAGGLASLPLLTDAAAGSGAISLENIGDGVLRSLPLLYSVNGTLYPGLGLEALRLFSGETQLTTQVAEATTGRVPGIIGVELNKDIFLPTAPDGQVWLHFRPLAPARYIPAHEILTGSTDPKLIKDHIVFIGATAKGLGDNVFSPLGELIPGIEGHVQLVEQLLTDDTLLRPAWENDLVFSVLIATWLLLWFMLARYRPIWSVLLTFASVSSIFALAVWLFTAKHLLLDPLYPSLAISALFLVMMVPRYLQTEWEQRWIRNAFSRYVSPNRVKYLQDNPQQLELGSIYRECSFVATDLEGFTPMMEMYEPDKLSNILNEYLETMIQIIFRHEGTLDRIVGDALMVMFSAPIIQADHAERALACAMEMDACAREFTKRQRTLGIPFGRTRIGVNTGRVLIGNFGGKSLLDYRALGDPINTTARLESINKQLGTHICVSGNTVAQCKNFIGRPAGNLVLKGKTQALPTYEPLSVEQMQQPDVKAYLAAFELMDKESPEANAAFQELAVAYPDDPLAQYHAKRLAAGKTSSTVTMTSK